MRKFFGTDGIRGIANEYPLTIDTCLRLSEALTKKIEKKNDEKAVIIGKDTRISGDMFEHAFAAAFASFGVNVKLIGVCPTPAVSILTRAIGADFGIMISASHNPFYDNGIKIFNADGMKLTDDDETNLESAMEANGDNNDVDMKVVKEKIARVDYSSYFLDLYIDKIKDSFSFDRKLTRKIKIVVDSSNGSFSKIAPKIFEDYGFDVVSIFDSPNGININENCGVTNPQIISEATVDYKADIGIAFDGDGDRLLMCDSCGRFLAGEHILAILVEQFDLQNTEIVSTIMANFGFEKYLASKGIVLIRTKVGDRYISEYMQKSVASVLGGEPSGHIIIREHALTGDGLFAALKILSYIVNSGKKIDDLYNLFEMYPCVSKNVRVRDKNIVSNEVVIALIKGFEKQLNGRGKLIVRPSGTEPLIRISAEGENQEELDGIAQAIADQLEDLSK